MLNRIFNKKIFSLAGLAIMIISASFLLAVFQFQVIKVAANLYDLIVLPGEIHYGTVFPQETLEKNFTVSLSDSFIKSEHNDIKYEIVQMPKCKKCLEYSPVSGVCTNCENDEYYYDLCSYLAKESDEGEGDTETAAYLNKTTNDLEDKWKVVLDVPCIEGYVGQDFEGTPVPEAGDYGCDIGVRAIEKHCKEVITTIYGGGGLPHTYKAALNYHYPTEKTVGILANEKVVINNISSGRLNPATLTIDLPEEYLELISAVPNWISYDSTLAIGSWNIPAIESNNNFTVEISVMPLKNGRDISTEVKYKNETNDIEIIALAVETIGVVAGEEYIPEEGIVAGAEKVVEEIKAKVGPDLWISLAIAGILTGLFWNRSLFRRRFRLKR